MKKICTNCKKEKELEDFTVRKILENGDCIRRAECRTCQADKAKIYRQSPKGKEYTKTHKRDPVKRKTTERRYLDNHPEQRMLTTAKSRAKKDSIPFNLTVEDIVIPERCPLLGIPMFRSIGNRNAPNLPSLDRIDSTKGYVKGNVWVISYKANTVKSNLSLEELESIARNLRAKIESLIL